MLTLTNITGFGGGGAPPDIVAPTITSTNTASVAENATLSKALTADEAVSWSIIGGVDQARFEISGSTLRWASNGTKDFEAPDDDDTDNDYVVDVRATDGASNTDDQTITVTVTDTADTPWTPAELGAVLELWFDYSDSGSITVVTGVSQANDKSGNNNHITQATGANQPTYVSAEQNGLNVARFDGTNDRLAKTSGLTGVPPQGSIAVVAKATGAGTNLYWTTDGISSIRGNLQYNNTNVILKCSSNNHATYNPTDNAWLMHSGYFLASKRTLYVGGTLQNENTTGTDNVAANPSQIWFGSDSNPTGFWVGDLGEFILCSTELSTDNRQKLEGYLAHKWGLEGDLDAGHPYKAAPPFV